MIRGAGVIRAGLLVVLMFGVVCDLYAAVASTKHNLSVSGPGSIKAAAEAGICIFCHAPHNAAPDTALWNRRSPGSTYVPYASSTTKSNPGQPNGGSLMCLSCHDGTIALGDVLSRKTPIAMAGGVTTLPAGAGRLGTDLSDDHPISIAYTASLAAARGDLAQPSSLTGRVKLDIGGQLQCSSCHDAHDDTYGKFLVMSNRGSALCLTCHIKSTWTASSHRTSTAIWNGVAPNPFPNSTYTTVADNACESCHKQHTAGGKKWLLNAAIEESNCYPCHNGHVASKNIQNEFSAKISIHPVALTTGVHDPAEPDIVTSRHVECSDCHNSHATNAGSGPLPGSNTPISGSLHGVRGITISGVPIASAAYEYQVCLRCHGDSPGQPAPRTTRQIVEPNIRKQFDPANTSYHPVAAVGKAAPLLGLIAPWTASSTMQCQDCHNNNSAPSAGGTGPSGPHGSNFAPLLERRYDTTGAVSESATVYAMCYKCHDRNAILGSSATTKFPRHRKHIVDERTPCNVCHDPHGISLTGIGRPAVQQSGLLNFYTGPGTNQVTASGGRLYADTTNRQCYMVCHGKNHNPCSYTDC